MSGTDNGSSPPDPTDSTNAYKRIDTLMEQLRQLTLLVHDNANHNWDQNEKITAMKEVIFQLEERVKKLENA